MAIVVTPICTSTESFPGVDLAGNTFWEFKDAINTNRFRRIVKYSPSAHYADIKITRKARSNHLETKKLTGPSPVASMASICPSRAAVS
jgi:hypothetical protein